MSQRLALLLITFFVIACIPLALIRLFWGIATNPTEARNQLVAFDRVGNCALNGNPLQTISARAYYGMQLGIKRYCILCKLLDWIQKDHCAIAAGKA
jgi:hypothetical protein